MGRTRPRPRLFVLLDILAALLGAYGWTFFWRWPDIEKAIYAGGFHLANSESVAARVGPHPRIESWSDFSLVARNVFRARKVVWTYTAFGPKSSCAADVELFPRADGWDIVGVNLRHGAKERW